MFYLAKIEHSTINQPEPSFHKAKASEAIKIGEALMLHTDNTLTKCAADEKPIFIAMKAISASETDRTIPVCRITPDQVYRVAVTDAPTSLKALDKVTISEDGMNVTATTTSGVVTIESLEGATKSGDEILVRIV